MFFNRGGEDEPVHSYDEFKLRVLRWIRNMEECDTHFAKTVKEKILIKNENKVT